MTVYDGLRESSSCSSREGKWCNIQEICRHTEDPTLNIKYKLLDLCKRGTVERKLNMDGKPLDLFRPVKMIDSGNSQIKVNIPMKLNVKNVDIKLPRQSSPGTWKFGYEDNKMDFLSAKPGSKIIRGEK
jgi:hypothetical protein